MLGKQGWKLMTNHDTIVSKVWFMQEVMIGMNDHVIFDALWALAQALGIKVPAVEWPMFHELDRF